MGGARFSAPVQTGPGAHPASYTMGTKSFPGVKRPGRGVNHSPPSSAEVKEKAELYICPLCGSSWPVLGRSLHLPLHMNTCIVVSCNVKPYGMVARYQHFIETCCFFLQDIGHCDILRRFPVSYLLIVETLTLCRPNSFCFNFFIPVQINFSESV